MPMIYAIFALMLVHTTVLIGVVFVVSRRVRALEDNIIAFITPPEEGKLSPLAEIIESMSENLAKSLTRHVGMALKTGSSALSRSMKAVENDIQLEVAEAASPLVAGLMEAFPTLRKVAKKNPALLEYGLGVAAKAMAGKGGSSPQAPSDGTQGTLDTIPDVGRINR